MRKVIVFTNLTLDGVMQAPGRPDEDTRDGFRHGGWGAPYAAMSYVSPEVLGNPGPMLFGRRTYQDFYAVWPNRTDNPHTEVLNKAQKYVASTTLTEPLPWVNSTLIKGNAAQAIAELKAQPGQDFLVMGSGVLAQSLMQARLVDRFVLLIHPLILGSGRKLFPAGSPLASLQLVDINSTTNGVVIATYQPLTSP